MEDLLTAIRRFGEDTPFGRWLRSKKELDSVQSGFVATDVDWTFHRYITRVDTIGTRDLQLMMDCEVKTSNGVLGESQKETLFLRHQILRKNGKYVSRLARLNGKHEIAVWHFGVFVLKMEGTDPTNGKMHWGTFDGSGNIRKIVSPTEEDLVKILGFSVDPRKPSQTMEFSTRRHHKNGYVFTVYEQTELGFKVQRMLETKSS